MEGNTHTFVGGRASHEDRLLSCPDSASDSGGDSSASGVVGADSEWCRGADCRFMAALSRASELLTRAIAVSARLCFNIAFGDLGARGDLARGDLAGKSGQTVWGSLDGQAYRIRSVQDGTRCLREVS